MASRADELAAAARAGLEAAAAMRHAAPDVIVKAPDWWYYAEQAVRMSRSAAHHAFRARPDLRPPDSYDIAVAAWRERKGQEGML